MAAPKGNQYGLALSDPIVRQKAYKSYCDHLATGKSYRSWYYEDGEDLCCYETMLKYIENNPEEFSSVKRKVCETKGFQYWESVCAASASGTNKDANTASLQMVMRNKYGWDKKEDETKQQNKVVFEVNYAGPNNQVEVLPKTLSE